MIFKKLKSSLNKLETFKTATLENVIKNPNIIKKRSLMFIDGTDVNGMNLAKVFEYDSYTERWIVYTFSLDIWKITFEYSRSFYEYELKEWFMEYFEKEGIIVKR